MNKSPHELLAEHALRTLPDSLAARRRLLEAARFVLPRNSDLRAEAAILIRTLNSHEVAQREFLFGHGKDGQQ